MLVRRGGISLRNLLLFIVFSISNVFFTISTSQLLNFNNSHIATSNSSVTRASIYYDNASALLADLLRDYDMRLRPGFGGQHSREDYTLTMYLHQYWRDERLSWPHYFQVEDMTLSGDFSQ
uniref:Neurotransmitter-gated ion-channel ligand-binding domain-containing protein n=1 Tax=Setaria digitata TaxID=48799 RepID=A0A915PX60_9BILA